MADVEGVSFGVHSGKKGGQKGTAIKTCRSRTFEFKPIQEGGESGWLYIGESKGKGRLKGNLWGKHKKRRKKTLLRKERKPIHRRDGACIRDCIVATERRTKIHMQIQYLWRGSKFRRSEVLRSGEATNNRKKLGVRKMEINQAFRRESVGRGNQGRREANKKMTKALP